MLWVYAALLCLLAAYVILAQPRWARLAAMGFVVIGTVGLFAAVDAMGSAKPVRAEWRDLEDVPVIGHHADPPLAIYVWVLRDGDPIAYRLPWSEEQARKLQSGKRRKRMTSDGGEMTFYPEPYRSGPPKQ